MTLLFTSANDILVSSNAQSFAQAFPLRGNDLNLIVQEPTRIVGGAVARRPVRGLALIDPRSRRRTWLRATYADGRRSAAPYRDYADFMHALEGRRPSIDRRFTS